MPTGLHRCRWPPSPQLNLTASRCDFGVLPGPEPATGESPPVGLNLAKAEISAKQGYLGKDPGENVTQQGSRCPISQLVPSYSAQRLNNAVYLANWVRVYATLAVA